MSNKDTLLYNFLRFWRTYKVKKFITEDVNVCDIGCGFEGVFLEEISYKIKKGIGLDLEVNENLNNKKIKLLKVNIDSGIPLEDVSADVVTCMALIEHIDNHNYFIEEVKRILKKGGLFILTTPDPKAKNIWEFLVKIGLINQANGTNEHKNYFTLRQLERIFKRKGFIVFKSEKFQFGFNNLFIAIK